MIAMKNGPILPLDLTFILSAVQKVEFVLSLGAKYIQNAFKLFLTFVLNILRMALFEEFDFYSSKTLIM